MKKTRSKILFAVLSASLAVIVYLYFSCSVKREYTTAHVEIGSNYADIFTDRNALQLTAADRMGIAPQEDKSNSSVAPTASVATARRSRPEFSNTYGSNCSSLDWYKIERGTGVSAKWGYTYHALNGQK